MKSYRDRDGGIRLFRPMDNIKRFNSSCKRVSLPVCISRRRKERSAYCYNRKLMK